MLYYLFAYWGFCMFICSLLFCALFPKSTHSKATLPSECQTVYIKIRPDIFGLIWVHTAGVVLITELRMCAMKTVLIQVMSPCGRIVNNEFAPPPPPRLKYILFFNFNILKRDAIDENHSLVWWSPFEIIECTIVNTGKSALNLDCTYHCIFIAKSIILARNAHRGGNRFNIKVKSSAFCTGPRNRLRVWLKKRV